jgi:magnesium transporter
MLEQIFDMKRSLIEMRRVMSNTRDVMGHLLRSEYPVVQKDLTPFLRDVYDHVMRTLDAIEIHRDLLTTTTELYLSSVANRTNQVMKALTVFGAVATPALVITGMYGMNLKHLPFADHPHSWGIVMTMIAAVSGSVLLVLRKLRWW